jgi:hypothetical protein
MRLLLALLLVVMSLSVGGCWAAGQLRYRDHPELAKLTLATGDEKGLPLGQLGAVTATADGYAPCDQLIAEALGELLAGGSRAWRHRRGSR